MRRVLAAALLALAGAAALPAPAHAATAPGRTALIPFAASADHLVYGRGTQRAGDEPMPGALLARTATGAVQRLATSRDLRTASARVAGTMAVFQADAVDPGVWHWRDLATGEHGAFAGTQTLTLGSGRTVTAVYRAPAPDGWVMESVVRGADHLYVESPDGVVTDLGAPEPGGDSRDQEGLPVLDDGLQVLSSGTALVVTASADETYSNGSSSVMSFARPRRWTRFIGFGHHPGCTTVTERYVACSLFAGKASTRRLYAVDGRLLVASKRVGSAAVAGNALAIRAYRATDGRRYALVSQSGAVRRLDPRLDARLDGPGPSGLGGVIVTRARGSVRDLAVLHADGSVRVLLRAP